MYGRRKRDCTESWLGRKRIPCRNGESNMRQRRAGPTLYQLSYIPTQFWWDCIFRAIFELLNFRPFWFLKSFDFIFLYCILPRYNLYGWLGVKHQATERAGRLHLGQRIHCHRRINLPVNKSKTDSTYSLQLTDCYCPEILQWLLIKMRPLL